MQLSLARAEIQALESKNREMAQQLDTGHGDPLISLTRQSFETHKGEEQLVDYLQVYYHPERFQYRMDLELDKR